MNLPKREQAPPTVSSDAVAQDQIRAFVERIIRMREEAKAINDDIREIYAEAKGNGFDKTILGKVVLYVEKRATKAAEMLEAEAVFELYLEAFDGGTGTRIARAHTHEAILEGVAQPGSAPQQRSEATVSGSRPDASSGDRDPRVGSNPTTIPLQQPAPPVDTPSNVTQLHPEKRITFNDKPHVDCLDPGQCGGFSNLGLCPRCKAVAGGGAAEIEHHGSIGR